MTLVDGDGNVVDSWDAANNTTNPNGDPCTQGSHGPAPNGEWPINGPVVDTGSSNSYGPRFIPVGDAGDGDDRNDTARQRGIGIHGGRNGQTDSQGRTGHEYNTHGCIRMEDDDVEELADWMDDHADDDPMDSITIQDEAYDAGADAPTDDATNPPTGPDDASGSVPNQNTNCNGNATTPASSAPSTPAATTGGGASGGN